MTRIIRTPVVPGVPVVVDGENAGPVTVFVDGDDVFAFEDNCTHHKCALSDGDFDGEVVVCACHFAEFSMRTGEVLEGPAVDALRVFPAKIVGDEVEVEISE